MKCINHNKVDAVGYCGNCGAGLCKECFSKNDNHYCDDCNKKLLASNTAEASSNIIKTIVISLIFAVVGWILTSNGDNPTFIDKLGAAYLFAGMPWGWSVLNMITPNIFLFLPLVGWLIYFSIKAVIAMLVGIVVMPVKIALVIYNYVNAKKEENNNKNN